MKKKILYKKIIFFFENKSLKKSIKNHYKMKKSIKKFEFLDNEDPHS